MTPPQEQPQETADAVIDSLLKSDFLRLCTPCIHETSVLCVQVALRLDDEITKAIHQLLTTDEALQEMQWDDPRLGHVLQGMRRRIAGILDSKGQQSKVEKEREEHRQMQAKIAMLANQVAHLTAENAMQKRILLKRKEQDAAGDGRSVRDRTQLKALEEEKNALTQEVECLTQSRAETIKELERVRAELLSARQHNTTLEKEARTTRVTVQEQKQRIAELAAKPASLQGNTMQAQHAYFEATIAELKTENRRLREELQKRPEAAKKAEKPSAASSRAAPRGEKYHVLQARNDALSAKLDALEAQYQLILEQNVYLRTQLQQREERAGASIPESAEQAIVPIVELPSREEAEKAVENFDTCQTKEAYDAAHRCLSRIVHTSHSEDQKQWAIGELTRILENFQKMMIPPKKKRGR